MQIYIPIQIHKYTTTHVFIALYFISNCSGGLLAVLPSINPNGLVWWSFVLSYIYVHKKIGNLLSICSLVYIHKKIGWKYFKKSSLMEANYQMRGEVCFGSKTAKNLLVLAAKLPKNIFVFAAKLPKIFLFCQQNCQKSWRKPFKYIMRSSNF